MIFCIHLNKRVNPTAGSPTVTLLRLHSSYRINPGLLFQNTFYAKDKVFFEKPKKVSVFKDFRCIQLPECDGRGVQGSGTYSPWRADPRLLVIPASCFRVAENNLNWGKIFKIRSDSHHCIFLSLPL